MRLDESPFSRKDRGGALKVVGGDVRGDPRDLRFVLADGTQPVSSYFPQFPATTTTATTPHLSDSLALTRISPFSAVKMMQHGEKFDPKQVEWRFNDAPFLPKPSLTYLKDRTKFLPSANDANTFYHLDHNNALVPYDGPIIEEVSDSEEYDEDGFLIPVTTTFSSSSSSFASSNSYSFFGDGVDRPMVESVELEDDGWNGDDDVDVDAMEID